MRIINDLTTSIRLNDLLKIKQLLDQLGKTPFIQKEKPNPYDEAVSLIWYLENVFYATSGEIVYYLQKNILHGQAIQNQLIKLGFWPGGDRDGNSFVTNQWDKVYDLYHNSLFFKTLLENSLMSLAKSFFQLTAYMKKDPEFGEFWQIIYDEFLETKRLLLKIADQKTLMENYPDSTSFVQVRDRIVLTLLIIQQYNLLRINELN